MKLRLSILSVTNVLIIDIDSSFEGTEPLDHISITASVPRVVTVLIHSSTSVTLVDTN